MGAGGDRRNLMFALEDWRVSFSLRVASPSLRRAVGSCPPKEVPRLAVMPSPPYLEPRERLPIY